MAKLTYQEHNARALLLGEDWRFHPRGFYYFNKQNGGSNERVRLDADTMEPLSIEEVEARNEDQYGYEKCLDG